MKREDCLFQLWVLGEMQIRRSELGILLKLLPRALNFCGLHALFNLSSPEESWSICALETSERNSSICSPAAIPLLGTDTRACVC